MITISENIKKTHNKFGTTQNDLMKKSNIKHTPLAKIKSDVVLNQVSKPLPKLPRR